MNQHLSYMLFGFFETINYWKKKKRDWKEMHQNARGDCLGLAVTASPLVSVTFTVTVSVQ